MLGSVLASTMDSACHHFTANNMPHELVGEGSLKLVCFFFFFLVGGGGGENEGTKKINWSTIYTRLHCIVLKRNIML